MTMQGLTSTERFQYYLVKFFYYLLYPFSVFYKNQATYAIHFLLLLTGRRSAVRIGIYVARAETSLGTRGVGSSYKNLFGMKVPSRRPYLAAGAVATKDGSFLTFSDYFDSVFDFFLWQKHVKPDLYSLSESAISDYFINVYSVTKCTSHDSPNKVYCSRKVYEWSLGYEQSVWFFISLLVSVFGVIFLYYRLLGFKTKYSWRGLKKLLRW